MELRPRPEGADAAESLTHPGRFDLAHLDAVHTVRDFDEQYTAPHFGFNGASDYYYRASAVRVIDRIRVPALIITAEDDPFVPVEPFRDPRVTANPLSVDRHTSRRALRVCLGRAAETTTDTGRNEPLWSSQKSICGVISNH